jgi:antitoxin component HigA of HigAB toxin-antitoxin module
MTATEIKPIRSKRDCEAAFSEIERLWGAKAGTPEGDRLDVLATLVEALRLSIIRSTRPIPSRLSSSGWSNRG